MSVIKICRGLIQIMADMDAIHVCPFATHVVLRVAHLPVAHHKTICLVSYKGLLSTVLVLVNLNQDQLPTTRVFSRIQV